MKKNAKRFAIGTAVAVAAGYVAGILTAPKSGKETRQDIKDTTNKSINEAEKQLKKLHTELTDLIGQAKEQVNNTSGKAKTELESAINTTQTVKEKARELLSAVHEGGTDDKDLKKAVSEATKAINHLKSFLKR
jgi:gas vesicle protein